jgi:isoquinoline 1-oxidoreductase beta subunit
MNAPIDLSRRRFIVAAGGGLVIAFVVPLASRFAIAQEQHPESGPQGAPPTPPLPQPNAFLTIGNDDSVRILLAHSEMGQGIWTALPMLVAEELGCDWSKVVVEHAPAAPAYAHTAFGIQATGGSTSVWSEFDRYRQVGALAREMLIAAAAAKFGVDAAQCRVSDGTVTAGANSARFGELADAAAKLPPPTEVKLKDRKDWRLLGKPTRRLDSRAKVDGSAVFGIDVRFEGLKVAVVARPPVFGGKLKSFDASAARAVKGVRAVVEVPSGIAVVADHFWAARAGRDALTIEWDLGPNAALDSAKLKADYVALSKTPGAVAAQAGDAPAKLAGAKAVIEAQYDVPYLAHAAMEPLNCTVRLGKDSCEIWTGTQFQTLDQVAAAKVAGLEPAQVTIHTPFLGGGFGRRANPANDFVIEAVHVAKASGLPVKVVWTREDDTRGGYYRPAFVHRLRAALADDGSVEAFAGTAVGQSILAGTAFAAMVKDGIDSASVEGMADSPYLGGVANHRVELHTPSPGVPVLWWRSVGHTQNAFAMEGFIDELAHAAKQDPVAFRRRLLKAAGEKGRRNLAVLERAVEAFGWDKPLPEGHGKGVAVHESFGSHVAQVAEVSVSGGRVRVHRVVAAIDCGVFVNPLTIEAQVQGAIVYGLSAALSGQITFREGRVVQSNFHDYPTLRLDQMPKVEVHLVDSGEKPGGVGEPGTPPIAPAVANAIFAATGQRLRSLPFRFGA